VAGKQKSQWMQDKLDGELSSQEESEFARMLNTDHESATQFQRLQQVETLLRSAPLERAPERLAVTIMARLAEATKAQPRRQRYPEISEELLQTALQLVTVAALPMLVGAGWMLLNAQSNPEMIETVLYHVAVLLAIVLDVMEVMVERTREVFPTDPELAMALLALMPAALLTLVQAFLDVNDSDDKQ